MVAKLAQKLEMEEAEKARLQEEQDMLYAKNLRVSVLLICIALPLSCYH